MTGLREKIRILHVLGSLDIGGCEKLCLDILRFHDRSRFEPQLVVLGSPNGGLATEFQSIPGLQIFQCLYTGARRLSFMIRFTQLCRRVRPDVVFCYAFGVHALIGLSARLGGVKRAIVTVQNPSPRERRMRRKTYWLAQLARPSCTGEVAASHYVANDIRDAYGLPHSRMRVIQNGCDVQDIHQRAEKARQDRVPSNGPVIGMVGRLDPIKDQATLIRATAFLRRVHPTIRLKLIGDGPERRNLEQLVSHLHLDGTVEFTGSRLDIPEQLAGLDVFAFSTTSAEGFGIAMIEALAAGVAVVATDVGSCREVLAGGRAGELVPPGDAEALAGGIARFLNDPALRTKFAEEGHHHALEHYDIRKTTRAYEHLLATLR